ncbi:hypothetical protein K2X14_04380 [Acetobacter sp. TBRC 12305]|uniref:Uncharacterized protein n=1 Tax=Acetobacter garciniae TaxID=2817435 RepID=A0A939HHB1_9PROT|nr:hypothetical protein [Acetobacter garciniae]MBO1324395.1 hypothetical protein [Acetobacter garciniae]MBX0344084.1 hypothetical protein [Acetobacter garciniae]
MAESGAARQDLGQHALNARPGTARGQARQGRSAALGGLHRHTRIGPIAPDLSCSTAGTEYRHASLDD